MNTLQHIAITLLSVNCNLEKFKEQIPYVLLPDAIRAYVPRQVSHFEINPFINQISYLKYCPNIKDFSEKCYYFYNENLPPCCVGEATHIEKFEETNNNLKEEHPTMYIGIKKHLIQDCNLDEFIRDIIDFSNKYEHNFKFNNYTANNIEIREIIADIEEQSFVVLAEIIYNKYNIIINQKWINENVTPYIKKCPAYSEKMIENVTKYFKIKQEINKIIEEQDFKQIIYLVDKQKILDMYEKTLNETLFLN